jgi:excinuclease UvrABC helicase subunit UvrB
MKHKKKDTVDPHQSDDPFCQDLRKKIEILDEEMRKAIDAADFDKAMKLSEEQERLLNALME